MFELTKEQRLVLKTVKAFVKDELARHVECMDENATMLPELREKMAQLGLFGLVVPEKYGGSGLDTLTYVMCVEEISKVCASSGVMVAGANSLIVNPLLKYGTEEQKEKYLPKLASGEWIGAFALTEPEAGSDASNQKTVAYEEGDYYVINGTKHFITGGDKAELLITFAGFKKQKDSGRSRMSAFLIEKSYGGITVGRLEKKLGIRASSTAELIFENVKVPKSNLLSKIGKGFRIALETLEAGRISIGAQALGIAQGAFEEAVKYSKERRQFEQKISSFQGVQWMIADMATEIEAARMLVYKAAIMKDKGLDYAKYAAMAKLYASEVSHRVVHKALQIHGGYGYMKDYPIERMYRDQRITEIYEGTSEIHRLIIANAVLKEFQD